MSDNQASSLPTPPSLQDLTVSRFESLEPGQQEALFHTLRIEIARLEEIEKDWCRLANSCPRLDTQIYLPFTRIEPAGSRDDEDDEDDGYKEMRMFREKWSYSENEHGKYVSRTIRKSQRVDKRLQRLAQRSSVTRVGITTISIASRQIRI